MYSAPVYEHMLQCQPGSQPLMMHSEMPSWKPTVEIAPNCPRCASANTKFCYYNNYSLSQPRYFCKGCRRYWTKGGSLRNVPVGGGCRKNRRSRSGRLAILADRTLIGHRHNGLSTSGDENPSEHNLRDGINGSDIDMADVFAKFLNPNSSRSIPNEIQDGNALCDNHSLNSSSDFLAIESVELLEELVLHDHQESNENESIQNIMGNDEYNEDLSIHEYGLQGLLDEEDVFWSDNTTSLTSSAASFNWQELNTSFASNEYDHRTKMSATTANLCNDNNWGAFDFSSLGVFSGS